MSNVSSSAFADTKAHYDLLDGLRGVAALMGIWPLIFSLSFRALLSVMRMTTVGVRA